MEPSIGLTGEKNLKLSTTFAYFASFVILGLMSSVLGPTLSGLARHTHSSLGQISLIFSARWFGYIIGSLGGGRILDRNPGHPILIVVLIVMSVMTGLAPIIPLLWLLILVMVLYGMAEATLDVGCNSMLGWLHGSNSSPFLSGLHFFFGAGAFLSPIVIAQVLLSTGDITWAFWILALLALLPTAWLMRLPSPKAPPHSQQSTTGQSFWVLIALIAALFFLYAGVESSFGGWIFTYTTVQKLASQTTAAYLTSTFWGSFTLGRLIGIPISTRLHPRTMLAFDLAGCLAGAGAIVLFPHSLAAVWAGTFGLGLFMASIFPSLLSLAGKYLVITGRVTGWFFLGAGLGGMTLPWLVGQLFDTAGAWFAMLTIPLAIAVLLVIFCVLLLYLIPSRKFQ